MVELRSHKIWSFLGARCVCCGRMKPHCCWLAAELMLVELSYILLTSSLGFIIGNAFSFFYHRVFKEFAGSLFVGGNVS